MGARFAKWRTVIAIADGIPSRGCIEGNVHALARYAALCQEAGLVPIVEPEVLMDGEHPLERCFEVTTDVLRTVFGQLSTQNAVGVVSLTNVTWLLPPSSPFTPAIRLNHYHYQCCIARRTFRCSVSGRSPRA